MPLNIRFVVEYILYFSARSKERKIKCEEWHPLHFQQDFQSGKWVYNHSDLRPWDPRNDLYQYENNYIIKTKTKHPTPMIRTGSIISVEPPTVRATVSYTFYILIPVWFTGLYL